MLIKSRNRGLTKTTWLDSRHSFSFADYHDLEHMGFSALRVINQDIIAPEQGFGMHSHHNMEILTYVLAGTLQHRDSLGNESVIRPGEVQCMSAGTGIRHSEWNPSTTQACSLLQIWIMPQHAGGVPGYQQTLFPEPTPGEWQLLAAPASEKTEVVTIQQDASLYRTRLAAGAVINYVPKPERALWLQVLSGRLHVSDLSLDAGDGLGLNTAFTLKSVEDSEILLFDLPTVF